MSLTRIGDPRLGNDRDWGGIHPTLVFKGAEWIPLGVKCHPSVDLKCQAC